MTHAAFTDIKRKAALALLATALAIPLLKVLLPSRSVSVNQFAPSPRQTHTAETVLRGTAIHIARPICPEGAIAEGDTVVGVAQAHVAGSGRVLFANVLEPQIGPLVDAITD